mmetsp:Transcript_961/g.2858  ORF Transcript_961/g.2858 Transcript_961/m.2858 type:complete len:317 (-) Transcript_961:593-1543(-)
MVAWWAAVAVRRVGHAAHHEETVRKVHHRVEDRRADVPELDRHGLHQGPHVGGRVVGLDALHVGAPFELEQLPAHGVDDASELASAEVVSSDVHAPPLRPPTARVSELHAPCFGLVRLESPVVAGAAKLGTAKDVERCADNGGAVPAAVVGEAGQRLPRVAVDVKAEHLGPRRRLRPCVRPSSVAEPKAAREDDLATARPECVAAVRDASADNGNVGKRRPMPRGRGKHGRLLVHKGPLHVKPAKIVEFAFKADALGLGRRVPRGEVSDRLGGTKADAAQLLQVAVVRGRRTRDGSRGRGRSRRVRRCVRKARDCW